MKIRQLPFAKTTRKDNTIPPYRTHNRQSQDILFFLNFPKLAIMVEITPVDENDNDIFSIESLVGPSLLTDVKSKALSTDNEVFGTAGTASKNTNKKKNKSGQDAQPSSKNPNLIGLYFSASWCPPCKTFTPLLTEFYNTAKKTCPDEFEIIFVSSDRTQEEFDGYVSFYIISTLSFIEESLVCIISYVPSLFFSLI
jgi:thiol-disulfide isomerase/thioredoxin